MCVYPADAPALSHPAWPCLFSLLMGVTNGYFGSVPMIQAAGKVPPEQRELAGEGPAKAWFTILDDELKSALNLFKPLLHSFITQFKSGKKRKHTLLLLI